MPSKSNLVFALVGIVALGGLAVAYITDIGGGGGKMAFADPDDAEMVTRGSSAYAENCADCHGKNLEGQPDWQIKTAEGIFPAPPHDASGHTWHHADQLLLDITRHGGQANAPTGFISGMPGFAKILPDDDIVAVLAYIKSRWPLEIRTRHALMSRKAAAQ